MNLSANPKRLSLLLLAPLVTAIGCSDAPKLGEAGEAEQAEDVLPREQTPKLGEAGEAEQAEDAELKEQTLLGSRGTNPGVYATRWVEHSFQAARDQIPITMAASRLYAMVAVAIYDAVNGIDRARGVGREQALVPPTGAPIFGLRAAAAATAAHDVIVAVTPAEATALDQALAADLAELGGTSLECVARGRDWGSAVAQQVVAIRSMDGTQTPMLIPASTEPGKHRVTYDAKYSVMTPFGIATKDAYQAPPPPELTSATYTADYIDAKAVGQHDGDPIHEEIATFWGGDAGTATESSNWLQAAVAIAEQRNLEHSISATARLYALAGMGTGDGTLVSHAAKAYYFTWRVVPAIHEADTDGNPDTIADPTWVPRNGTGNLSSPEYIAGAPTYAGAGAAAIEHFFCTNDVSFCFSSDVATRPRCWATPAEAAIEAGRARVYQGVHFQHSVNEALTQGRALGTEIATQRLRRVTPTGEVLPACTP